jgi:short-subunit dehydrogenase involved in D-alanine esterification of teichoic acids
VVCDVTDERQVRDLANTVRAKYENVDIIINSAGLMTHGSFLDVPAAVGGMGTTTTTFRGTEY